MRKFKACEPRETAAYYGVCEDFEGERNKEFTILYSFYSISKSRAVRNSNHAGFCSHK